LSDNDNFSFNDTSETFVGRAAPDHLGRTYVNVPTDVIDTLLIEWFPVLLEATLGNRSWKNERRLQCINIVDLVWFV